MSLLARRCAPFRSGRSGACHGVRGVKVASYGGRNGILLGDSSNDNSRPGSGLIMPGQSAAPSQQRQGLVVPGDPMAPSQAGGLEGAGGPPVPNKFRPPPGFMNDTLADDPTSRMQPQEMLARLTAGAGKWFQQAKLILALNNKGYDGPTIEGLTGIAPSRQSIMCVAATVHDSLVASAAVPPEALEHFDYGGDDLLHPFRFLPVERRVAAALYIYQSRLGPPACEVLARAMKEWERRPMERAGFSDSPADCMAFKYMRDALECRRPSEMAVKLAQALQTAGSDTARERLFAMAAQQELQEQQGDAGSKACLEVLKLSQDELGFKPIPQVASLDQATAALLLNAPKASQTGPFGAFAMSDNAVSCRWVALPQWRALALASHPVGLSVDDCSNVPGIMQGTRAKGVEDKKRLAGPGLLVVDVGKPEQVEDIQFYMVVGPHGQVQLVDGATAAQREVVAKVLFIARPPIRESVAVNTTELLAL